MANVQPALPIAAAVPMAKIHKIHAAREVIVSGGTINSPHLLQLSGIGNPELLNSLGIEVKHALPGVGENLRDHYGTRLTARAKNVRTINELARGPRLLGEIAKYFLANNRFSN